MSSAICCAAYLVLADEHFAAACTVGQYPLPTERSLVTDTDFAAYACQGKRFTGLVEKTSTGHVARAEAEMGTSDGAVAILSDRRHCKSNRQEGLGVDGIAIGDGAVGRYMLSLWPHYRVACGFPAQSGSVITLAEVVADTDDHNRTIIAKLRPGLHDDFLLSQSLVDADKGFGTYPMTWSELIRTTQGRPFRLIPRCVIVQPSGKKRIIDDAAVGGQSELSSDYNKLVLCSALRLAQHVAAIASWMSRSDWEHHMATDHFESGGEDWPDAYRHSPISREESLGCVVIWWHHGWQQPAFQLYNSLLFGLPLAVTSFNRYSRFVKALGRRLLACLVSMYFDDANVVDWASSKGASQKAFVQLNEIL